MCIPSGAENIMELTFSTAFAPRKKCFVYIFMKVFSFTRPFYLSLSIVKNLPKTAWQQLEKHHSQVRDKQYNKS